MPQTIVGISEIAVSTDEETTLVTYSLGSCVALSLHDPVAGVGGLLHAMMPSSRANAEKAAENPAAYTDTAAQLMLQRVYELGATRKNLVAKVVGAASHAKNDTYFKIGERNYAVMRKVLWKNEILIAAEDVGGCSSRTVYLEIGSGRTLVRTNGSVNSL